KTIGRYLGRGYTVKASMGHIRDLPKGSMGGNVDDGFEPKYLIPRDKSKIVTELKARVQGANENYLATDPDREGEAIAWHLIQATDAQNKTLHRVVFHEITPSAVTSAIENPREIDMDLVDAQQARRVLDRLVGYSVSPLLWKKVKRGLSAGRVQSIALKMIIDREEEIRHFKPEEYWTIDGNFKKGRQKYKANFWGLDGKKHQLKTQEDVQTVLQRFDSKDYQVTKVEKKERKRNPAAPFTTSSLQQEAARKLNFRTRKTMMVAQQLY